MCSVELVRLRYRLLWAQSRSRQGRLILLGLAYLVALAAGGVFLLGGFAAGRAAIQLGRAEMLTRAVLGAIFVYALVAAVMLGAGIRDTFSDRALRRFPMSGRERFMARHLVTLLEPTWVLALAVYAGLAIGLRGVRGGADWVAFPASLLLLVVNYLAARVLVAVAERMLATRVGTFVLVTLAGALPIAAIGSFDMVRALAARGHWLIRAGQALVTALPPALAAPALAGAPSLRAGWSLLLLLLWAAVIGWMLAVLEARPVRRAGGGARVPVGWGNLYDRAAALFGPRLGPLVGKMIRYYARSPHVRYNAPILVLAIVQLLVSTHLPTHAIALAGALLVGLGTGGFSSNVFGFDGSGFRRYALLPVSPLQVVGAAAIAALLPGVVLLPIVVLTLGAAAHGFADPRMLALVAGAGITGLLLCQAVGQWTSILAPRPMLFHVVWGQPLSLGANAMTLGAIGVFFVVTWRLSRVAPGTVTDRWWLVLPVVAAAAVSYVLTVWAGAKVLGSRSERLIHCVEGLG